jgi:hypothetical protein
LTRIITKTYLSAFLLISSSHYFSIMMNRSGPPISQSTGSHTIDDKVPTVAFCEMVKNPQLYFGKSVRLTAIFEQATEGQYLSDPACELSHDDQIGVGYVTGDPAQQALHNKSIRLIHSPEYGSRVNVTLVGILRDSSRRDFAWYRYRFDIISFENISHITVQYQGDLQAGTTYLAAVHGDGHAGLSLAVPVRILQHYAVRVEWTNLGSFPELKRLSPDSGERQITFSVLSDDTRQMTANRWNRTVRCKIVRMN